MSRKSVGYGTLLSAFRLPFKSSSLRFACFMGCLNRIFYVIFATFDSAFNILYCRDDGRSLRLLAYHFQVSFSSSCHVLFIIIAYINSIFSPSGKLMQIEYALNAVKNGQPSVGLKVRCFKCKMSRSHIHLLVSLTRVANL